MPINPTAVSPIDLNDPAINLTLKARQGNLHPLVGREAELNALIETLLLEDKGSALLVGPPGVGKTALAQGLAMAIASNKVPARLKNNEVILLTMNDISAGTGLRGQQEERVKQLIRDLKEKNRGMILFIDEAHTMMENRQHSNNTFQDMLKPALADGDIRIIGCTTDKEADIILQDAAFGRRFERILIQPPDETQTLEILAARRLKYEKTHNCKYDHAILKEILRVSKELPGHWPDKALTLMDRLGARAERACKQQITNQDIEILIFIHRPEKT